MRRPRVKSAWWGRLGKEYFYCPEDEAAVIVIVIVMVMVHGIDMLAWLYLLYLVSSGAARREEKVESWKEVEGDGPGKVNDDC